MLPALLPHPLDLAASAFNALTAQESWAREKLARHADKRISLVAGSFRAVFLIAPDACLSFLEEDDGVASDVTLTLPLAHMSLPLPGTTRQPWVDMIHISGEAGLAQALGELSRGLRWDVEDTLARWVGDVPAVRLVDGARRAGKGAREVLRRLAGNAAEYLSEEADVVLGTPQMRQWQLDRQAVVQQLDELSARADAVGRRLARLETIRRQGGRP